MVERVDVAGMAVAKELYDFVETQALPGTGIDSAPFWSGLSDLIHNLGPENQALLDTRDTLQAQIDDWHKANSNAP
ncbi:MAG: malate synthase G, partial [Planktomarina sp.]